MRSLAALIVNAVLITAAIDRKVCVPERDSCMPLQALGSSEDVMLQVAYPAVSHERARQAQHGKETPTPAAQCERWCEKHSHSWLVKCSFKTKACSGCSECLVPSPAPTPEPVLAGAPWTSEEARIVMSKLGKLSLNHVMQLFPEIKGPSLKLGAAKWIRFGFHQCLKNKDGSGGCNGCMNFENVFTTKQYDDKDGYQSRESDNNNLGHLAFALEQIYTDENYPLGAPSLSASLKNSGKSRADLWAFAAQRGLQMALLHSKKACNGITKSDDVTERLWEAIENRTGDKCRVDIPLMKFSTGRVDCPADGNAAHPFISTKPEKHPDPYANGFATLKFFREEFDFNPQESVAIMGAHSLGQFHPTVSGFKYQWTRKQITLLNNQYYMNLATKPYSMELDQCGSGWRHCSSEWGLRPLEWTKEKGPFLWFQSKDQTAISADMGLYYSFDVAEDGRPLGCPGMPERWSVPSGLGSPAALNKRGNLGADIRYDMKPRCPKNDEVAVLAGPGQKEKKMYEVVEQYANSHQTWINDFIPAFEKMLQNGQRDLVRGPDVFTFA